MTDATEQRLLAILQELLETLERISGHLDDINEQLGGMRMDS
jgi:hypothetical protein